MDLKVHVNGKSKGKLAVSDEAFNQPYNEALIHQVVTAYLAGGRQGSKAQLSRSDVSGGGKKPWRQKGTGRARAGTTRGPIWRTGGVTFAAKPRDFSHKVNKKMYKGALRSIVSELVRQDRLVVVDDFALDGYSTKTLNTKLKELSVNKAVLIDAELSENLYYSARNLRDIDVLDVMNINPVSLIRFDHVVITKAAVEKVGELLA